MRITSSDNTLRAEELVEGESTHEETDTRIIQYILLARDLGYTHVRVHSPDSDVLLIQLLHSGLFHDMVVTCVRGAAGKRREVSIAELRAAFTPEQIDALIALHVESGVDTTSASFGRRQKDAEVRLLKSPAAMAAYSRLGQAWQLTEDEMDAIESFICDLCVHVHTNGRV